MRAEAEEAYVSEGSTGEERKRRREENPGGNIGIIKQREGKTAETLSR